MLMRNDIIPEMYGLVILDCTFVLKMIFFDLEKHFKNLYGTFREIYKRREWR